MEVDDVVVGHGSGSLRVPLEFVSLEMKCSRSLTRCDTKRPGRLTFCGDGGTDVGAGLTTLVVAVVVVVIVLLPNLSSSPSEGTDLPNTSAGREGGGGRGRSAHPIPLQPSELPSVSTSVTAVATASIDGRWSACSNIRDDVARSLDGTVFLATTVGDIARFSKVGSCLAVGDGGVGTGIGAGVRSSSASTFGNTGVDGIGVGVSVGVDVRSTPGSIEDEDDDEQKTIGNFSPCCCCCC